MTNAIGTSQDLALQPAAAAARPKELGAEALQHDLDQDALEGRDAVQGSAATAPPAAPPDAKGANVDRVA